MHTYNNFCRNGVKIKDSYMRYDTVQIYYYNSMIHQIVVNKRNGLDVSLIDSTVRGAAVLGKNFTFRRR